MKKLLFLTLFLCSAIWVSASHLRCGFITIQRQNCSSRSVFITVTVFTNTASEVRFGEDGILDFGDGTNTVIPRVENTPRPDLGPNIGIATYTVNHTYSTVGSFLISYVEPNRNGGVLNMTDSFFTTFYTETKIDLTTCVSSPVFLAPPIFPGLTNDSNFRISLGAGSFNDKLITYELGIPYRDRGLAVNGYVQPPNMSLNKLSGLLSWFTDGIPQGEYNFAVIASQWDKEGDLYRKIGFVRIDFQVILQGDAPEHPVLSDDQDFEEYSRILVTPGEEKEIELSYESGNNSTATLEVFSELNGESFSFTTNDVGGPTGDIKTGLLTLAPQASDVRTNGYMITVRGRTSGNPSSVRDINYLIYTDEIQEFPIEVDPVTSTEKDIAQIEIFPNPVQQQLNVEVNRSGESEVLLYTAQGVLVKAKSFELKTSLSLNDLAPGVYICDVKRNNVSQQKIKLFKTE